MSGLLVLSVWDHIKQLMAHIHRQHLHSKTPIPSVTFQAQLTTQWLDSDSVVTILPAVVNGD